MFRIDRRMVDFSRSSAPHLLAVPKSPEDTAPEPEALAEPDEQEQYVAPEIVCSAPEPEPEPAEVVPEAPPPVDTEKILREAEAKAGDMVKAAKAECDELKNQAWQEGYSQGKAEAREELKQQRLVQKEALNSLIERVNEERNRLLDEVQDDVVRLSVDIARKILHYELDYGNDAFISMVYNAVKQMKAEGRVVVRVSPQEYARYFSEEESREFRSDNMIVTVIEDNYLERGGCVIESEGETINASVDSQLKTISIGFGRQVG